MSWALLLIPLLTLTQDDLFKERKVADVPKDLPENAGGLAFSRDGKVIAYTWGVDRGGPVELQVALYVDGKKIDGCRLVPSFSPDGKRYAYVLGANGAMRAVIDGKEEPIFYQVGTPIFSRDSKSVAYSASEGRRWLVVADGKKGETFDGVSVPQFRFDGKVYYTAEMGGGQGMLVVDGEKGPPFSQLMWPVFGADGSAAYVIRSQRSFHIVLNGQIGEGYDQVWTPAFSPDGKTLAYSAAKAGKALIVVDGKARETAFRAVTDLEFLPDGKTLAYVGHEGGTAAHVVGDKRGKAYPRILWPTFSPDGKSVAYVAQGEGNRWRVVAGDVEGPLYEMVSRPAFSPTGLLLYTARREGKNVVVIGGKEGVESFNELQWPPIFSRDGGAIAFRARKARELWWKVLDLPPSK